MNRKEAIEKLKKYVKDSIEFYEQSISTGFEETSYYHQMFSDIIKAFEQPITLADFLGWEEGIEYEADGNKFRIKNDSLIILEPNDDYWGDFDYAWGIQNVNWLRQATKVEKKETKEELLDELQKYVSSERINEIIEKLRRLDNE